MKESKTSLSEITIEPVLRVSTCKCNLDVHVHNPKCELNVSCYDNDIMVVLVLLTFHEMHEFVQCVACMLINLIECSAVWIIGVSLH